MFLFTVFELSGIVAFALSGALLGMKKGLDFFGVIMLSVTTALGGGIVRDIIIGNTPPVSFQKPIYFVISAISAVVVLILYEKLYRLQNIIVIVDAIGLGVFTAIGANIAVQHGIEAPFIVVSLAMTTGIGGSIIRDVFVKEVPYVFRKEVYAVASIIGGIIFVNARHFFDGNMPLYLSAAVTIIIRLIAIYLHIDLPNFHKDLGAEKEYENA